MIIFFRDFIRFIILTKIKLDLLHLFHTVMHLLSLRGPFKVAQLLKGDQADFCSSCTSWYFLVLLSTSRYFFVLLVLLCTSSYFLVLLGTSSYFLVLLGTSSYFLVLPYTSWYFCSQNRTKVFCYCAMSKTLFLKIEHLCSVITNKVFDIAQ